MLSALVSMAVRPLTNRHERTRLLERCASVLLAEPVHVSAVFLGGTARATVSLGKSKCGQHGTGRGVVGETVRRRLSTHALVDQSADFQDSVIAWLANADGVAGDNRVRGFGVHIVELYVASAAGRRSGRSRLISADRP